MAGTPQPGPPYRAGQSPAAMITSDALITAVTSVPSARPSSRTASTVIEATRRVPPASSSTLAIASPVLMLMTRAGIWWRALSFICSAPRRRRSCRERTPACPWRRNRPPPGSASAGSGALRMTGPWRDRSRPVLDADPAQVPRDPAIVSGPRGDGQLDHGFVVAVVTAAIAERIVQVGPPLRGGHQAGLDEREPV